MGSRIWLDGQGWEVAELDGVAVRLRGADTVRTVSLSMVAQVMRCSQITQRSRSRVRLVHR